MLTMSAELDTEDGDVLGQSRRDMSVSDEEPEDDATRYMRHVMRKTIEEQAGGFIPGT